MNYLTVNEAAEVLRLSPWTIRRWLTCGRLRRYKAGAATRIDEAELRAVVRLETPAHAAARNTKREHEREAR